MRIHTWLIGWTGKLQVDIQLSHPLEGPLIPFVIVRVQFILHKVLLQYGKGKSRFYQQDTP
jgi:hypothetical protein